MARSKPITLEDLESIGKQIAIAEFWMLADEYNDFQDCLAEAAAENAWVRAQENKYDPEAQADLEYHNWLWPNVYGRD